MGHGPGIYEVTLLFVAGFLLLAVLASKVSSKLGVPSLLLFVGIGMLAGSDGPGGIVFENFEVAKQVGLILAAFILFSGGLDTDFSLVRPILAPGLLLSSVGVFLTAGLIGLFAHYALGFPLMTGLLLGAIVSSTDSAAILSVIRQRGLFVRPPTSTLLEFESGTNDPMAVFLTIGIAQVIVNPDLTLMSLAPRLFLQMGMGAALGYGMGVGLVWLINRLRLDNDGLYSVVTLAGVGITYGAANVLGGSEYLAVYVAGLTMSQRTFLHKVSLIRFHDGIAWLLQICVFMALGLLAFPSQLLPAAGIGTAVAVFLILVARPVAVWSCLVWFKFPRGMKRFMSWAGLRGAFPIILGTVPILSGIERGHVMFNIVFFVVLLSVLIQGSTMRALGRRLDIITDRDDSEPALTQNSELLEIEVSGDSRSIGRRVFEVGLPQTALIALLKRDGRDYVPTGGTILKAGDRLFIATRREDRDELRSLFS